MMRPLARIVLAYLDGEALPADEEAEAIQALADCGVTGLLTSKERAVLRASLAEALSKKWDGLYGKLVEVDWIMDPVTPQQFLEDEHYFGHVGSSIWPSWTDTLHRAMHPKGGVSELILTGAIGIGKTTIALIIIAYRIYLLSCLRDPYDYYGQARINRFYFGLYNVYRYKADEMYLKLKEALNQSPFFQQSFPSNNRKKDVLEFPRNTSVISGASELESLGENLIACHLSEVNFMRAGREDQLSQAWKLYRNVTRRIKSRFMFSGSTPGIVILDSSRKSHTDMLEEHLEEVRGDPSTLICEGAIWDFRPSRYYSGVTFRVAIGTERAESRILETDEAEDELEVIEVPAEYRKDFDEDIDGALRDIAGRATHAVSPFMPSPALITAAEDPEVVHPFTRESICVSTLDTNELEEYLVREKLVTIHRGRYAPRRGRGKLRFAHMDLSRSQDPTGFAMGYIEDIVRLPYESISGDVQAIIPLPVIRIEMMLQIQPPPKGEIDYGKLRRFLAALRDMGFDFGRITFDGFQSVDMQQILRRAGFRVGQQSVDRAPCVAYQELRSAVTEQRVRWYHYPPFVREVTRLQRNEKGKVDHPHGGSKDVADCVAGVIWLCQHDELAMGEKDPVASGTPGHTNLVPVTGAPQHVSSFTARQLLGSGYKG